MLACDVADCHMSLQPTLKSTAACVVQDVKEIAGSVKKSVSHLREEFQPDEKLPAHLPGEIPNQDERELSDGSDKELDAGLGVRFCCLVALT